MSYSLAAVEEEDGGAGLRDAIQATRTRRTKKHSKGLSSQQLDAPSPFAGSDNGQQSREGDSDSDLSDVSSVMPERRKRGRPSTASVEPPNGDNNDDQPRQVC